MFCLTYVRGLFYAMSSRLFATEYTINSYGYSVAGAVYIIVLFLRLCLYKAKAYSRSTQ